MFENVEDFIYGQGEQLKFRKNYLKFIEIKPLKAPTNYLKTFEIISALCCRKDRPRSLSDDRRETGDMFETVALLKNGEPLSSNGDTNNVDSTV